jgi:hypothetical protein
MNQRIEHCLYQAGLTAQGCWDELDDYAKEGIEKFAQLIVQECMQVVHNGINNATDWDSSSWDQCCENRMYAIQKHFGVEP